MNRFLTYLIVFIVITGLSNTITAQVVEIDTLKVYYLPWNLKTKGALVASDVRNFNNNKNYYFESVDDSILTAFDKAINVYNFQEVDEHRLIDVRMVLDFMLSDGNTFTIELGANSVKIGDKYYRYLYSENPIRNCTNKFIPEKLALKGEVLKVSVKKDKLSQKEIKK